MLRRAMLLILFLAATWILRIIYGSLPHIAERSWIGPLLLHSFAALLLFMPKVRPKFLPQQTLVLSYVLPLAYAAGISLLLVTGQSAEVAPTWLWWELLSLVVVVPVVEEFLFRAWLGRSLQRQFGTDFGASFSAFLFACCHAPITADRWLEWPALALGPFLLAWINEHLFRMTGRLGPCILLHGLANASAILLSAYAQNWLDRLSLFYIRV